MTRIDKDVPAFPRNYNADGHNGMTLRDWFAGQALVGIMAGYYGNNGMSGLGPVEFADEACQVADAMLAARSGGQDDE